VKAYYCDSFVLPLPQGHRFPMEKYRLRRERVATSLQSRIDLCVPPAADDASLLLAHDGAYLQRAKDGALSAGELRALGFPWSPQLVERSRRSAGATIAACRAALSEGAAANLAGGTHHAFRDRPEGFCLFNDSAVAARWLQQQRLVRRLLVVDTDVHQGNGTAAILRHDDWAYTFSIHCQDNFPFLKERSDLDLGLPAGAGDPTYLEALAQGLRRACARAHPDLIIYLAGADGFEGDRFGKLALSKAGLAERDALVFGQAGASGVPVALTMAGGYAHDVRDTVDVHYESIRQAAAYARSFGARAEGRQTAAT
jgi:acetoin utilization deacetylase AcuC-like enzyme